MTLPTDTTPTAPKAGKAPRKAAASKPASTAKAGTKAPAKKAASKPSAATTALVASLSAGKSLWHAVGVDETGTVISAHGYSRSTWATDAAVNDVPTATRVVAVQATSKEEAIATYTANVKADDATLPKILKAAVKPKAGDKPARERKPAAPKTKVVGKRYLESATGTYYVSKSGALHVSPDCHLVKGKSLDTIVDKSKTAVAKTEAFNADNTAPQVVSAAGTKARFTCGYCAAEAIREAVTSVA